MERVCLNIIMNIVFFANVFQSIFLAFRIIKKTQIISEYNTNFQNVYLIGQVQICMINYFGKKTTSRG